MNAAASRDALQPRQASGLLPGAGLSLLVHVALVVAIALGVSWQRQAQVEFSAELWSALPEVAAPRAEAPAAQPQPAAPATPPQPAPAPKPAPPPPAHADAEIALERERSAARERAEQEAQRKRAAEARRAEEAKKAADAKRAAEQAERDLKDKQRAEQKAQAQAQAQEKAQEQARLDKLRQDNLKRLQAQAGGGSGGPSSQGQAARDAAPSQAYAGRLIRHIKSRLVMADIDRLPPTLEAVVEVRATASGTVLSRRLVKASGNAAWDNAVLRAVDGASPLPRDADGRVPGSIEIVFRPGD